MSKNFESNILALLYFISSLIAYICFELNKILGNKVGAWIFAFTGIILIIMTIIRLWRTSKK
jgi:hypothetical protein